ncbi:MAG TPA: YdiU family protein [Novosphingobium sp.]|nr:YdiU family protein [Novosphingobium sp.]
MRSEPQPAGYRPDPQILSLAPWLADAVAPAAFPQAILRFRNNRWAAAVGLDGLDDEQWIERFARFAPLDGNLPGPLALRYHGHQFQSYNPDIGDGRGFLYAQLRDAPGRLLDFGTKGSGQTPYSRFGDGRLTLKGACREILATEMLEALGTYTSKTFSVIETGEALERGDEPSPTRSAVLVRLSHGHVRIGSFQRLAVLEEHDHLAELIDYCLREFPGPPPPEDAPGRDEPAVILLHQAVARLADMAASYMVAGFVHGVLNTDNMNITGESFDYGPWRWLPRHDPAFTAAYFDHSGLYAYGRQPSAIYWNCGQLAIALSALAETTPLMAALERFGPLFQEALARRFCWRLGVEPSETDADLALMVAAQQQMVAEAISPDTLYFRHRGGRAHPSGEFGALLAARAPRPGATDDPFWAGAEPPTNHIDVVESLWSAIDRDDDWAPLHAHVAALRRLGHALGQSPEPAAHP